MDGGTVQAHIPLAALSPILRPEFGGTRDAAGVSPSRVTD